MNGLECVCAHRTAKKRFSSEDRLGSNVRWDGLLAAFHRDYLLGVLIENEVFAGGRMR